jgi:hypothetical protein
VVLVIADDWEERIASTFRETKIGELEAMLITSN